MQITSLTLGEAEEIETLSGVPFTDLVDIFDSGSLPPIKVMIALAFIFQRRDRPALTIDDVRAMSIDDLTDLISDDSAGDVSPE